MEVMELQSAAGGGANLLMFCKEEEEVVEREEDEEEEEEEVEREEEDQEEEEEALVSAEEETDLPPVRTLSIPGHPDQSPPPHLNTLKSSGAPLGFKLNGRLLTGGGAAELKLSAHPVGSASGFTKVQIHEPAVQTSTPVITGVVSGEAAHKVLSICKSSPPPSSPWTRGPPQTPEPPGSPSGSRPPHKLQVKGPLGPASPPNCLVCRSRYKLVTALRGFMCLCSPAIAQSLKNLKKKKKKPLRRSRGQKKTPRDPQTYSKVSRTRPGPPARTHGPPEDFLSARLPSPSPPPSSTCSPPAPAPPHGKLVIMVEDFYYGRASEPSVRPEVLDHRFTGPYRCIHCEVTLSNNIQLMAHMQQHSQEGEASRCPQCFRHFLSPVRLQAHIKAVHSQHLSTAKCKICELQFVDEAAFLLHMKSSHKPGEMPYSCQVCNFHSSFYSDVWSHFHQFHSNTKNLLCQFCLRVMRSNTCYQQHFTRHQKHMFGCDKCRLHFLCIKERIEHKVKHRTHVRPPQLIGLKPGTTVTVRTYSVDGGRDGEDLKPLKVDVKSCKQEVPKRKPMRSLGSLLLALSQESVSRPPQRCLECLSLFQDFQVHFPSLVLCSLCNFITCCSTSYANHMINNHSTCRRTPPYLTIFRSQARGAQSLRCVSCTFTTCRGDAMADHLMKRKDHQCIILKHNELRVDGENQQPSLSVTSLVGHGGGAFIPIHLLPSGQTGALLSVTHISSPPPLSSPPAMTIKILGPRPQPEQASALTAAQLSVVLFSLCHGLPPACCRFRLSHQTIRSWTRQRERRLAGRKWIWRTEKLEEWVLIQHEQQLSPSRAFLLRSARSALGQRRPLLDCYGWIVDFLLTHQLGLQPTRHHRRRLPKTIRDTSRLFKSSLATQSRAVPPHGVGSMDEFSIFLDLDQFSQQNPSALRLSGSPEDLPVFDVVLSALSDGRLLPPLLFFRGAESRVPNGFPDNVLLAARQEGFSDPERLRVWTDRVWRPLVASRVQGPTVLMMDVYRGHLADEFRARLTSMSTGSALFPPGSRRLQPLHVCVTPVLSGFLQARWTQLVSGGGLGGLGGLDQLALTVACWLSEVTSTVTSETHLLRRSFLSVCELQEGGGGGGGGENLITALTKALVQQPDSSEPQLELLLVMEEEEDPEEVMEEEYPKEEEEEHPEVMEEEDPEEVMEEEHPKEEEEHPEEVMKEEEEHP